MGFIMDGLDAETYDRHYNDRALVRRIVGYFAAHKQRMIVVALIIVLSSLLQTALPIFISRALDLLQVGATTRQIVLVGALITGIACFTYAFNFVRRTLTVRAVGDVVLTLREDAFDAVLERDLSFYDSYASGKIVSRVSSDTQAFSQVVTLTMDLLGQLLLIGFLVGYLFTVNGTLTLIRSC